MEHMRKHVLVSLALTVGLVIGGATTASAAPTEVLGDGPEAGGVAIADSGAGHLGERRSPGALRSDGGGGSFWQCRCGLLGRSDVVSTAT